LAFIFTILGFLRLNGFIGEKKARINNVASNLKLFILIGLFHALMVIFHCLAIIETKVSYMIAVKRTSLIFSVLYGSIFFKEKYVKERLFGCLLMVCGVGFILF
jgi:uncharacterized membrane protein